jgi:hypothetical protein
MIVKPRMKYLRVSHLIQEFQRSVDLSTRKKKLNIEDFWTVVKPKIPPSLVAEVEQTRSLIMSPLSHAHIISVFPNEVKDAICIIQKLQQELDKL